MNKYWVISMVFIALFAFNQEIFARGEFRGGGGGDLNRDDFNQSFNRANFDNQGFERRERQEGDAYATPYDGGGNYGGYGYYVNPYPPEESSPGEGDDTDALYQYYLQQNNERF
jgi:hypothetical protein